MNMNEIILDILAELTGTEEVRNDPEIDLFGEGLLDSIGAVEFLIELEARLEISVPPSEFDRALWGTPRHILEQVELRTK
ncbi:D-alanine--poly(phosphoribitol) ligase subunit 2 [Clostridia bacterium]|nr:D-alanine--poly(phosphoribitol) ligase subunit 2 [Clostridia bacterium]